MPQVPPVKVAIVGIGHIAQHQIEAVRLLEGRVVLAGAYDRNQAVAQKFAGLCPFHASLEDLIATSPADLVVVSTPNADHVHTVSALLKAGRAVMVEKPVCENQADLDRLLALAAPNRLFLHTALHAAFALDLLWWMQNRATLATRLGPLARIRLGFYDPYIGQDGAVVQGALGLGGSWYDSGINALSVLERIADPDSIRFEDARMFSSPGIAAAQISGSARFAFTTNGAPSLAEIETDWTLGLNRKTSWLSYQSGTVLLDHSGQKIVIRDGEGTCETIPLENGVSRLTNQYVGVFADMAGAFVQGRDNRALSSLLHALLFAAADTQNGARALP